MDTFRNHQSLPSFLLVLLLLFFFLIPSSSSAHKDNQQAYGHSDCSPSHLDCGSEGEFPLNISYPFWTKGRPEYCGYPDKELEISCDHTDGSAEIVIESRKYHVTDIDYENQRATIVDKGYVFDFKNPPQTCLRPSTNTALDFKFFNFTDRDLNFTFLYDCPSSTPKEDPSLFEFLNCSDGTYFTLRPNISELSGDCKVMKIPILETNWARLYHADPSKFTEVWNDVLAAGFEVTWNAIDPEHHCPNCVKSNGHCGAPQPICYCNGIQHPTACLPAPAQPLPPAPAPAQPPALQRYHKKEKNYIIGGALGGGVSLCLVACILLWCYRRKLYSLTSSKMLSRAVSSNWSPKSDLEKSNCLCGTHFFDYKDLAEATNNFDPSKELGDGGFGIVYHGKLRDGRIVAVKRLYENNCRRVEQFKNEIRILSYLRHQNLVTLYGCSSRHSRELLLVYEFIPNGTVADHLHGDRAKPGALTWPTRMSIAIETADALKYLHAVEIVHRDVKTNNILLDNNFHVKVADFGLSRLFPTDVTHVSTAPQGTPGYVDPDYRRCYQLTNKSDVYSFGVVLIELISSKPAVDITRHRHEINLANMAINKIINSALHELVDPNLGFESDHQVRRMITSVAGLAFRCLQDDKDSRPPMEEVLECLRGIENEEHNVEKVEEVDRPADDEVLLKKMPQLSPDAVTEIWESRTATPNTSG